MKLKTFFMIVVIPLIVALFYPYLALWLYEMLYSSTKICLSDFFDYLPNTLTGIVGVFLSYHALQVSIQNKKISLEASQNVIRTFIKRSCLGFKASSQKKSYRYYRIKYNDLANHLQHLINADRLNPEDEKLCDKIYNHVITIKDGTKQDKTFDEIKNICNEFWDGDEYKKNVKDVLDKLENLPTGVL